MRTLAVAVLLAIVVSIFFFPTKTAAQEGKALYEGKGKCKSCHGVDGKGSSVVADMFKVEQDMMDLTNQKVKKMTDADIIKVVRKGQGKMKAIQNDKLSDIELKMVISHVRTLQK